MGWQLDIHGRDGTLRASRSNLNPSGVLGGFTQIRLSRHLSSLGFQFPALLPALGIESRDILRLSISGVPVAYGPVVDNPSVLDRRKGTVKVAGASDLLARRVIRSDVYKDLDVALIVRDLVQRYRHPAITYDENLIPLTGKVVSFSQPWLYLSEALATLGKTINPTQGVPLGVLPDGRFFFGAQVTAPLAVAYADVQGLDFLTVNGDEVVTRSYLVALNRASGSAARRTNVFPLGWGADSGGVVVPGSALVGGAPYRPGAYTLVADDPVHADVGAEAAHIPPTGADVFTGAANLPLTSQFLDSGLSDVPNILDTDLATYASNIENATSIYVQWNQTQGLNADPIVGFRVTYSLDLTGQTADWAGEATLYYAYPDPDDPGSAPLYATANFDFDLPDTKGNIREVVAVRPLPDIFTQQVMPDPLTTTSPTAVSAYVNLGWRTTGAGTLPAGRLKIYSARPIGLDRAKVDTLARTFLKPPGSVPAEFTVRQVLLPTPTVSLTGVPNPLPGQPPITVTGDVAEIEITHDLKNVTSTAVRLGQNGDNDLTRAIRLTAERRSQGAQTQLRGYLEGGPT